MVYSRIDFWIFFAFVWGFFYNSKNDRIPRTWVLLISSLIYYYAGAKGFLILLVVPTIFDHYIAKKMERTSTPGRMLLLGIFFNGIILLFYKLIPFLSLSVSWFNERGVSTFNFLNTLAPYLGGTESHIGSVVFPIGISFYTFQRISYLVDVYQKKTAASDTLLDHLLFITFFPQLIAGPILRKESFYPQIMQPNLSDKIRLFEGTVRIGKGLIKKIVIADYLGVNFVDPIFANPSSFNSNIVLCASIGYAIQVYCDFSGYIDISMGIARYFGLTFPENFKHPYQATNIPDFWRKWNVSLTEWLRDCLYVPLGGNDRGGLIAMRNIFFVLVFSGLWHRFGWNTFLCAVFQFIGFLPFFLFPKYLKLNKPTLGYTRYLSILATFLYNVFVSTMYRSPDVDTAFNIYRIIFSSFNSLSFSNLFSSYPAITAILTFASFGIWAPKSLKETFYDYMYRSSILLKVIYIAVIIFLVLAFEPSIRPTFIYFKT